PALGFYKLTTEDVIVIHDELDLPLGRLKIKRGGGHGGHNGLRSLMKHLPDDRFIRVRIGIGRPPPRWDTADYVLSKFKADEWPVVDKLLATAADAVESICQVGISKAMAQFNKDPDKGSAEKKKRVRAPASSSAKAQDDDAQAGPPSREGARPAEREDKS
ncbi:MAG: aminoacyl-tRNA hydrolase, partial [Myxococcota bacterium]